MEMASRTEDNLGQLHCNLLNFTASLTPLRIDSRHTTFDDGIT
jgi:hypothetical protein